MSPQPGVPLVGPAAATESPPDLATATYHLGRWIAKHIPRPETLLWVLEKGGTLHPRLRLVLRDRLRSADLDPRLRCLWEIVASTTYSRRKHPPLQWIESDVRDRWNATTKAEFLDLLRPVPSLKVDPLRQQLAWRRLGVSGMTAEGAVLESVRVEIELAGRGQARSAISALTGAPDYLSRVGELADELTGLLAEALDWGGSLEATGAAVPGASHVALPSIHLATVRAQRAPRAEWTYLISLTRDAFEALDQREPDRARALVARWSRSPHPVFQRLILFAATVGQSISPKVGAEALLEDGARALWAHETGEECRRFLTAEDEPLSPMKMSSRSRAIDQLTERSPREVAEWLMAEGTSRADLGRWADLAAEHPALAIRVLKLLAQRGKWPPEVWEEALHGLRRSREREQRLRLWRPLSRLLLRAPSSALRELAHPVAQFLERHALHVAPDLERRFLDLWDQVWSQLSPNPAEPEPNRLSSPEKLVR